MDGELIWLAGVRILILEWDLSYNDGFRDLYRHDGTTKYAMKMETFSSHTLAVLFRMLTQYGPGNLN